MTIDNTGTDEVTAQLQAALNGTPDGGTFELPPGRYRCEEPLELYDRNMFTVEAEGATIFATTTGVRGRDHFRIKKSYGTVVHGLTVEGPHPDPGHYVRALEGQHGYHVVDSHATLLDGVTVRNTYADGVYMGSDSTWVHVKDSTLKGMGRHGVCMVDAKIVGVTGCTIEGVGFSSVDMEPNAPQLSVWGVLVSNNRIIAGRLSFLTGAGTSQVDNVHVDGNVLSGNKAMGIACYSSKGVRRKDWSITNNTADKIAGSSNKTCMTFRHVDGLIVTGNTQPLAKNRDMVLADLQDCTNYEVSGNELGPNAAGQYRTRVG